MLNTDMYVEALSDLTERRAERLKKTPHTLENRDTLRDQTFKLLVLVRLEIQNDILVLINSEEEAEDFERMKKVLKKRGITTILPNEYLRHQDRLEKIAHANLTYHGNIVRKLLNSWQGLGASLEDLCHLCNNTMPRMMQQIAKARPNMCFSDLVLLYGLDYKSEDSFDYSADAPLTIAIRDWLLKEVANTKEGKEMLNNVLTELTEADHEKG